MPKSSSTVSLSPCYDDNETLEIGIDEAGRGPLFGRVYTAAVVLPKSETFDHSLMKDSKKFHSAKKINEAAEYIKKNALFWKVAWSDEDTVDKINIRQATFRAMHDAIREIVSKSGTSDLLLLVDGNDFKTYSVFDESTQCQVCVPHLCFEGGDNKYSAIAAASILAKTSRDQYIEDLCKTHPTLDTLYGIGSHKGYGTKKHLEAIRDHGVTPWHRKSFGICKSAKLNNGFGEK